MLGVEVGDGGEGGIRTREAGCPAYALSRRAHSSTLAPLRIVEAMDEEDPVSALKYEGMGILVSTGESRVCGNVRFGTRMLD